jgi:hypothetical protein
VIDVSSVDAVIRFDLDQRVATTTATMQFRVLDGGPAAFDLRQDIGEASLDGIAIDPATLDPQDLGGGDGAEMRVIDAALPPGSTHELTLRYELATPRANEALPVGWDGPVLFDLWMSDLHPGRYLEMWLPANLCHDRFSLTLEIEIVGAERRFQLLHNGLADGTAVRYPRIFTSLSPMLVVVDADELVTADQRMSPNMGVTLTALRTTDVDLPALTAATVGWIEGNVRTYGNFIHGDGFTGHIWDSTRGMEYDGATTASVGALEHEVFHSWFGRGVKPASQNDGWIDEAYTTWSTASGRYEGERFAVVKRDLDEPPVTLCPDNTWQRSTPTDSYREGARLFAGVAHLAGGAGQLEQSMAAFYGARAGRFCTTRQLEDHLAATVGDGVKPLFHRYVYGRD